MYYKPNKKKDNDVILTFSICAIIVYFVYSFVLMDLNPFNWDVWIRLVYILNVLWLSNEVVEIDNKF